MTVEEWMKIEKHYEEIAKYEKERWKKAGLFCILAAMTFLALGIAIGSCMSEKSNEKRSRRIEATGDGLGRDNR